MDFSSISDRRDYTYRWANSDTAYHQHNNFYEFVLITQGSFTHTYNKESEILEKGSLLLFDVMQGHRLVPNGTDSVHFALCMAPHYFEALIHMFLFQQNIFKNSKYIRFQLNEAATHYLFTLANNIPDNNGSPDNVKLFFYNAMSYLSSDSAKLFSNELDVVDDICEKIRNYSYLTVNMTDIYKLYPYSTPTIIKKFKARTGSTPVQFQTMVRLQYAAQLLCETTQPTEQIIASLGFHSSSHFYELFKTYYNQTPNAYREKMQGIVESQTTKRTHHFN